MDLAKTFDMLFDLLLLHGLRSNGIVVYMLEVLHRFLTGLAFTAKVRNALS